MCAVLGWVMATSADALGSFTETAFMSKGAVTMNTVSSTSITSTSGVTLISLIMPSLSLPVMSAISFASEAGLEAQILEGRAELLHLCIADLDLAQEVVVGEHGRHGGGDADGGGDQRFADGAGDDIEAGGARGGDVGQGVHDAPDRAEQADEGRGGADAGEDGQAFLHAVL